MGSWGPWGTLRPCGKRAAGKRTDPPRPLASTLATLFDTIRSAAIRTRTGQGGADDNARAPGLCDHGLQAGAEPPLVLLPVRQRQVVHQHQPRRRPRR
eukprot:3041208-Pyramimonas_sp.AAC.1